MNKTKRAIPLVLMLALAAPGDAMADASVEDIVDDRALAMKKMEKAIKGITRALEGDWDQAYVSGKADFIKAEVARMPSRFPKGSMTDLSDALPDIWKKWKKFEKAVKDTDKRAAQLVAAAKSGKPDRVLDALRKLNKSCAACHGKFRAK